MVGSSHASLGHRYVSVSMNLSGLNVAASLPQYIAATGPPMLRSEWPSQPRQEMLTVHVQPLEIHNHL
jgi:hypothetical protein